MRKNDAIFQLYPQVVTIKGDDAFDSEGNIVSYSESAVQEKIQSKIYIEQRAAEYPPITDYLDGVVKGSQSQIDSYIAECLAVKAKYPKPT